MNAPGLLLKSGGQLSQEELQRKAARASGKLTCADGYIKLLLQNPNFNYKECTPNELASYAFDTAEQLLSKFELDNTETGSDRSDPSGKAN